MFKDIVFEEMYAPRVNAMVNTAYNKGLNEGINYVLSIINVIDMSDNKELLNKVTTILTQNQAVTKTEPDNTEKVIDLSNKFKRKD